MHIYYNNLTFTKDIEILIVHENGEKTVQIVPNREAFVSQLIFSMITAQPTCHVIVHIKSEKLLSAEFLDSMYAHSNITIRKL